MDVRKLENHSIYTGHVSDCVCVCVSLTPVVDDEQLLSVSDHAHHGPRQAEDFSLDSADGEESEHQGVGGDRRPALTHTQRLHVLALRQVHHPLLIGVP